MFSLCYLNNITLERILQVIVDEFGSAIDVIYADEFQRYGARLI